MNHTLNTPSSGEQAWAPNGIATRKAGRATPRTVHSPLFLQRDLSDEALRKPAEPLFAGAQLAAAREEGFEAGRVAGLADAAASRASAKAAAEIHGLGIIAAAMGDACKEAARIADMAADALARTLIAAMNAVMPELIQRSAVQEVSAMLAHILPGLSREPALRIEVSPEIADDIARAVTSLAPELADKVSVVGMDTVKTGDARVRWALGHAKRQPDAVWQSIMEALSPALSPPEAKDCNNGE